MIDTFNEYLTEQAEYTPKHDVNEGFMDYLKKDWDRTFGSHGEKQGWAVRIKFNTSDVVDEIKNKLLARNEFNLDSALNDKENFQKAVSEQIVQYVQALKEIFLKNSGHLIIKPEGDKSLVFVFDNYTEKDPKGFAKNFMTAIQNTDKLSMSFLADSSEIFSYKYLKSEVADKEVKNNVFNNKNAEITIDNDFVSRLMLSIYEKVKETVVKNADKAARGELIKVYSIPFKIDDSIILNIAKENKNNGGDADTFYTELTNKVNSDLKGFLEQLTENDNIKSYLGFIPVKTYGFNLYFKDRSIAEEASETLNQEGNAKVTERMRYEKKISKLPQVLEKSASIGGVELRGPENAADWFKKTKFVIEHIDSLIGKTEGAAGEEAKSIVLKFEYKALRDMNDGEKTAVLNAIDRIDISESFRDSLFGYLLSEVVTAKKPTKTAAADNDDAPASGKKMAVTTLKDALKGDNIKYVEPIDVVKLVVSKMKSVLDAIAVNTKSNVDVKFDQESGTITVKYQQKAEAKVKAYLKAVRDSIPKFITA